MKFEMKDHSKVYLCISAAIVVVALVMSLMGMGMNLGIDFTGGMLMTYNMGGEFEVGDIQDVLNDMGAEDVRVAKTGDGDQAQIRLKDTGDSEEVSEALETKLSEKYPAIEFVTIERVGAIAGRDLINNALMSVLVASALMLLYIAFRFDLYSGIAAVLALVHDVLIMIAFMVFLRSSMQVNSTFIAALLTIVGYSINNTIIIFDRIRENEKANKGKLRVARTELVNRSVGATMSRTISTTLTTLFTVVALYAFGVDAIREFSMPLIIGILAGTYSSVGISGYLWAFMMDKRDAYKAAKAAAN